jgi:hypothetical protein
MQTGPPPSVPGHVQTGSVAALWRYPVKSMMGEELNSCEVTGRGLLGDRQFAVVDRATGKVGGRRTRGSGATSSTSGPPTPSPRRPGRGFPRSGSPFLAGPS